MTKDWIVYIKNDKINAVESEHTTQQINNLNDLGVEIIFYLAAKNKRNAISYAEAILE